MITPYIQQAQKQPKIQEQHAVILRTMFQVLKQSSIKNINSHQTT